MGQLFQVDYFSLSWRNENDGGRTETDQRETQTDSERETDRVLTQSQLKRVCLCFWLVSYLLREEHSISCTVSGNKCGMSVNSECT